MLPLRDHEPSHRFPFVTIGLIAVNVLAFLRELAAANPDAFLQKWALVPALVDLARPATLLPFVTSQFLHGGVAHIGFNMWYLWVFGDNVEGRLGHARYTGFYLLSGVIAALTQFFFSADSTIPMLGASGAVAGVLGAYLVFFPRHRVDTLVPHFSGMWTRATLPASGVLFFWFITQLFSGIGSFGTGAAFSGGVAWWAHIGGFAFGWMIARLLRGRASRAPTGDRGVRTYDPEVIDTWK